MEDQVIECVNILDMHIEPDWDASPALSGARQCHCAATQSLKDHHDGWDFLRYMEESECLSCFQEVQKGGSEELWASQLDLNFCEADKANNPRNRYQTHKGQ